MKKAFLLTALFMLTSGIYAQDTILAVNVFRHSVIDGKNTPERNIVEQQTYNRENQLILRVNYFDSVVVVKDFTRYYYNDEGKLTSEEFYTAEGDVIRVKRLAYEPSGKLSSKKIWKPENNSMINIKSIDYSYSNGELSAVKVLNHKGKWVEKHGISRVDSTETTSIKYHKKNEEKLKTETIIKVFSDNKLFSKTSNKIFKDEQEKICELAYTYDSKDQLTDEWITVNGELQKHIKYSWYSRGTQNTKRVYSPEEELLEYYHYIDREHDVKLDPLPLFDLDKPLKP